MFCPNCGSSNPDNANNCTNCGASFNNAAQYQQFNTNNQQNQFNNGSQLKSKLAAGLFGIFLGGWGVHNFYLGFTTKGIIQIVVTLVTCGIGSLWGLIEGILILCGNINRDANGNPLKD